MICTHRFTGGVPININLYLNCLQEQELTPSDKKRERRKPLILALQNIIRTHF